MLCEDEDEDDHDENENKNDDEDDEGMMKKMSKRNLLANEGEENVHELVTCT